jgi:hypothetical protein
MSARAAPRPWAAQEPDEDGIAIIGLRTNNGLPYDSPTNGIVALVVMWPTEVDANDTERAKANAAFIVEAVNSHEALKEQVAWWEEQGRQYVTRIEALESEFASCRECRANLDCLSRGAVPVRDDGALKRYQDGFHEWRRLAETGAERIRELEELGQFLVDRLEEFDPGDDQPEREFHGHVAPAAARLRSALQPKDTAK